MKRKKNMKYTQFLNIFLHTRHNMVFFRFLSKRLKKIIHSDNVYNTYIHRTDLTANAALKYRLSENCRTFYF